MGVRIRKFAALLLLSTACLAQVGPRFAAEQVGSVSLPQSKTPSLIFSSLLASVSVDARSGRIKLGDLHATTLPEKASGRAVLLGPKGDAVLHWNWKEDSFPLPPPYKLLAVDGPFASDGDAAAYSETALTTPGPYALDFYVGKERFYTFRFSLRREEPEDRSIGEVLYLSDGAWNDWGYLYYANKMQSKTLFWKIFLRDENHKLDFHKVNVRIIRLSDGKLVCRSPEDKAYHLSHDWVRHDFFFYAADSAASGTDYFAARDLLRRDGAYALEMDFDGRAYGRWLFEVKAGKIVSGEKEKNIGGDPLSFVDGGLDAWWLKKEPGEPHEAGESK